MKKQILAGLLALVLVLTLLPTAAFAAGGDLPFTDVTPSDSFYSSIRYVYEKGVFKGVSADQFSPYASTTRAMLVTVLHRLEGTPAVTGSSFQDVPAGTWYTMSAAWGSQNGIIEGMGDGTFRPNDVISCQDVLVILHRFAQYKDYDTSKSGSLDGFSDKDQISAYARNAISWAVGSGLISSGGKLDPAGPITRAKLAEFAQEFLTIYVDTEDPGELGKFSLRANKGIVFIGSSAGTVNLYLETKLKSGSPTLQYSVGGAAKTANLHDDGLNGDDIAGDGVFSASISASTLNLSGDTEIAFTASYNGQTSNTVTVQYFAPISEYAYQAMEAVDEGIENCLSQPGFGSKSSEEKFSEVEDLLNGFVGTNQIQEGTIKHDEEAELVSFLYPDGILGGVMYGEFEDDQNGSTAGLQARMENAGVYAQLNGSNMPVYAAQTNEGGCAGTAIILNSFPSFESDPEGISFRTGFYQTLKTQWDNAGLYTTLNTNPTVEDYKNLDQYNVACFSTHGSRYSYWDWFKYHEYSAICLAERQSRNKNKAYEAELKSHQIAKVNGCYWILPAFFENQYDESELSDTFVFAECCEFMGAGKGSSSASYDYTMANALTGRGVKACVGFHNSVFAAYAREMMRTYVNGLIGGETSQNAYNDAVGQWGVNHAAWFQNTYNMTLEQYYKGEKKSYNANVNIAYPVHRGDANATLVNAGLKNGGFEQYSSSTSAPSFWECMGDVRTLTQLGAVKPYGTSGSRMAILTTGIGAQGNATFGNGTEGSRLSQTFMVPNDASEITFAYNFVSEEPMEYVGSKFDDSFVVMASQGSNVFHETTYESINTSDWISVSGVDFTGGDNTAFQTTWKQAAIDVSAYRGKVITLSFIIYDVGDQLYDSACLIDSVSLH